MTIFVNGKQNRVKRPAIDGIPFDEFLTCNADPAWLHQSEMWHLIPSQRTASSPGNAGNAPEDFEKQLRDIPF